MLKRRSVPAVGSIVGGLESGVGVNVSQLRDRLPRKSREGDFGT